ncbi:peptide deformylase [Halarsenatibacter silvermanii]|uniref:Peptide deformylase n=1 Tax=Halarsenatibacter silvermanii TaxID=321763 RepID=A0A1G9JJ63_9FIRM|nr:peptide deformylase [Halarsenatibacter silvermanii]SDL37528.1 peptide deformylase [Halarsenatibacter silvermanii]
MAVLPLKTIGDPILRSKAKEVENVNERTREIIKNMKDTLHENEGLGLAANQVGILQQIVVISIEDEEIVLINPEIVEKEGRKLMEEGCLSVPGRQGAVPRAEEIMVEYRNEEENQQRRKFSDLAARVIQHEIDHLKGELFVDKVVDISSAAPEKEPGSVE